MKCDIVIVIKLDRLARSSRDLLSILYAIAEAARAIGPTIAIVEAIGCSLGLTCKTILHQHYDGVMKGQDRPKGVEGVP